MAKPTLSVSLEPIDRLADKVQTLIRVLEKTRAELSRTAEDNVRLSHDVDTLRAQVATTEGRNAEAQTLRTERDQVRARVAEMLDQLEELSL